MSRPTRVLALAMSVLVLPCFAAAQPWPASAAPTSAQRAPAARAVPTPDAFQGPRDAWLRLGRAIARRDRAAAMKELTPNARERHASDIDALLAEKRFDAARFGRIRSVTLSGDRFASLALARKKDDGTYGHQVLLMRGEDGRWRIDRL